MGVTDRWDALQRRHPWAGFPLGVLYKYFDDQDAYLAALIAYYAFVSLFPLLLLLSTILGFVLAGDPVLQRQMISSALGEFPVIGPQLGQPKQIGGGLTGLAVAILDALYSGLGMGMAVQNVMNTGLGRAPQPPPGPPQGLRATLLLLATVGLAVVATTILHRQCSWVRVAPWARP